MRDMNNLIFDLTVAADVFRTHRSTTDDPREAYWNASHAQLLADAAEYLQHMQDVGKLSWINEYRISKGFEPLSSL